MRIWHIIVIVIVVVLVAIWATGGFGRPADVVSKGVTTGVTDSTSNTGSTIKQPAAESGDVKENVNAQTGDILSGLNPITKDSGYVVFTTVSQSGPYTPVWPEGTDQTSVGYSNPEEYPDGRTFATRSQSNPGEIMVFVANCLQVGDIPEICQSSDASAIVGMIIGDPSGEYFVKLRDAEIKTLTIPGGINDWRVFANELAKFISANKGGSPVEILGPAK